MQLFHGAFVGVGFAEYLVVDDGNLVTADDQGVVEVAQSGAGLGFSESGDQGLGVFSGQRRFVDFRFEGFEGITQFLQDGAPEGGGGGED